MQHILLRLTIFILTAAPLLARAQSVELLNPLTGTNRPLTPFQLYGRLVNAFIGVIGAVALFFFVLGGFMWLTSQGNEEKIKKGKATLVWATLGIVIILGSYLILSFIIEAVTGAAT